MLSKYDSASRKTAPSHPAAFGINRVLSYTAGRAAPAVRKTDGTRPLRISLRSAAVCRSHIPITRRGCNGSRPTFGVLLRCSQVHGPPSHRLFSSWDQHHRNTPSQGLAWTGKTHKIRLDVIGQPLLKSAALDNAQRLCRRFDVRRERIGIPGTAGVIKPPEARHTVLRAIRRNLQTACRPPECSLIPLSWPIPSFS